MQIVHKAKDNAVPGAKGAKGETVFSTWKSWTVGPFEGASLFWTLFSVIHLAIGFSDVLQISFRNLKLEETPLQCQYLPTGLGRSDKIPAAEKYLLGGRFLSIFTVRSYLGRFAAYLVTWQVVGMAKTTRRQYLSHVGHAQKYFWPHNFSLCKIKHSESWTYILLVLVGCFIAAFWVATKIPVHFRVVQFWCVFFTEAPWLWKFRRGEIQHRLEHGIFRWFKVTFWSPSWRSLNHLLKY